MLYKKIVFMNVPLCTSSGTFECTEISTEEAKELCQRASEFGSAIGHTGATEAISFLLDVSCEVNRIAYIQQPGEMVICLKLKSRMPEGCGNLTYEKMREIGFIWYRIEKVG